jgi:plasmid stabilization system protein ParE
MPHSKPLTVTLSLTANLGIQNIAAYLANRFSAALAIKYIDSLESAFVALALMPEMGMVYRGAIRKFIWKKYTLIFYEYDADVLYITNIEDSRSNYSLKLLS